MYETADIRKGLRIELDSEPYAIIEFQFVKPGKGNAFTRTRIRNLINGSVLDRTFKTGEKLKPADTQDRTMQFLYRDEGDGGFHFMDNSSYEQVALDSDLVGDATNYLVDNMEVNVAFFRERPIGITLPNFVVLKVVEAPPGEKGNTVTGASKPVVVSTGYAVNAPMFVSEGELLKIDTRTGEYVERVKA